MSTISIAGLQLEAEDGDNQDAMEAEIDSVAPDSARISFVNAPVAQLDRAPDS